MTKILLLFFILITLLTGCQNNNIQTATTETFETESTTETDSAGNYSGEITSGQSTKIRTEETEICFEEWINRVINIASIGQDVAYFYDINRDGAPELILDIAGGDYDLLEYEVYNIFGEKPHKIGRIATCSYDSNDFINENQFDLYYDENVKEYFYISTLWDDFHKMVIVYKNTIHGEEIYTKKLAQYIYDLQGEKLYICEGLFLEKEVIEPGFYDPKEMNRLLGLEDYLKPFTLVEKNICFGEKITSDEQMKEKLLELCAEQNITEQNFNLKPVAENASPGIWIRNDGLIGGNDSWIAYFVHKKSLDKNGNEVWALWKDYAGTFIEMGLFEINPEDRIIELYADVTGNKYLVNRYMVHGEEQIGMYSMAGKRMKRIENVTQIDEKKYKFIKECLLEKDEIPEEVHPDGPTVVFFQENITTGDPIQDILEYMENDGVFEYYFYDFTKDGYPEVMTEFYPGLQSNRLCGIRNVVNKPNENQGEIVFAGREDAIYNTLQHYYDPSSRVDIYYNILLDSDNEKYNQVTEAFCWYKDGIYLNDKRVTHEEKIPKEDKTKLKEYIEKLRKNLEQYEFVETIHPDVVYEWETYVDGYEDIIKNYGKKAPFVDINVNGTVQTYPWNTYRFEITEDFDWSELNKLPNLKFVKVDLKNPNADYEKLKALKNISTIEIVDNLENYDWIGEMTWLQGVTLGKCSNLNFTASLKNLRFINAVIKGNKDDAYLQLYMYNKKCKWICLE